jgi:hypothetical protein
MLLVLGYSPISTKTTSQYDTFGTMKWFAPTGSVHRSADGAYMLMQANAMDWVAYYVPRDCKAEGIAVRPNAESARSACDDHATARSRASA